MAQDDCRPATASRLGQGHLDINVYNRTAYTQLNTLYSIPMAGLSSVLSHSYHSRSSTSRDLAPPQTRLSNVPITYIRIGGCMRQTQPSSRSISRRSGISSMEISLLPTRDLLPPPNETTACLETGTGTKDAMRPGGGDGEGQRCSLVGPSAHRAPPPPPRGPSQVAAEAKPRSEQAPKPSCCIGICTFIFRGCSLVHYVRNTSNVLQSRQSMRITSSHMRPTASGSQS